MFANLGVSGFPFWSIYVTVPKVSYFSVLCAAEEYVAPLTPLCFECSFMGSTIGKGSQNPVGTSSKFLRSLSLVLGGAFGLPYWNSVSLFFPFGNTPFGFLPI